MEEIVTLNRLAPGEWGEIAEVRAGTGIRRRLTDLGLIAGTRVVCLAVSPLGGLSAYRIRGAVIAIRHKDCCEITLRRRWGEYNEKSNRDTR
ncbi:MAG: ferrous iron transport protein A [Ruminococcaceae bacterium]|nr:ferrous iron transport protein A [Oscillospiraceae bacterium]